MRCGCLFNTPDALLSTTEGSFTGIGKLILMAVFTTGRGDFNHTSILKERTLNDLKN
jgi:hypothetical protein